MKKNVWKKTWDDLPRATQDLYLTLLWDDGHSEQAIADFFSTTKGPVVRRRQTGLRLPTEGRGKIKKEVNYDHFLDLLEIHKMRTMESQNGGKVACIAPVTADDVQRTSSNRVRPKTAASEATQCVHRDEDHLRCAFEWTDPGTRKCDLHK